MFEQSRPRRNVKFFDVSELKLNDQKVAIQNASDDLSKLTTPGFTAVKFFLDTMFRENGPVDPKISKIYNDFVNPEAQFRKQVTKQLNNIEKLVKQLKDNTFYFSVTEIKTGLLLNIDDFSDKIIPQFNLVLTGEVNDEKNLEVIAENIVSIYRSNRKHFYSAKSHIDAVGNQCNYWSRTLLEDMNLMISLNILLIISLSKIYSLVSEQNQMTFELKYDNPLDLWLQQNKFKDDFSKCAKKLSDARLSFITNLHSVDKWNEISCNFNDYFESNLAEDPFHGDKIDNQNVEWNLIGISTLINFIKPVTPAELINARIRKDEITNFYNQHKKDVIALIDEHITNPVNAAVKALDVILETFNP